MDTADKIREAKMSKVCENGRHDGGGWRHDCHSIRPKMFAPNDTD